MALSIKDEDTDKLVRRYAQLKGVSYTKAIRLAVSDAIARDTKATGEDFTTRLKRIQQLVAQYPRNDLTADEILGYDENGLPT